MTWEGGDVGKINPPLREKADCEALWAGIALGSIDTVATDHVHRDVSAKAGGIWKASPGCPGTETLLAVMLSEGHVKRGISLARIVDLLCETPAKAMGLWGTKGAILPGFDADFAIVDTNASWRMSNENVQSSAGYSIYDGWTFTGKVVHTLVRGTTVVEDSVLVENTAGTGRYLKRTLRSGNGS